MAFLHGSFDLADTYTDIESTLSQWRTKSQLSMYVYKLHVMPQSLLLNETADAMVQLAVKRLLQLSEQIQIRQSCPDRRDRRLRSGS